MQLPTQHLQRIKNVIHGIQGFVGFIAWALTIAVFTKPGDTDGRTKYFFALCFFTIPFLIYLAAVPVFHRTKRFANPYAFAVIDVLFAILWLAAFAAVAAWTNAGKDDGCDKFKFGTPGKCKLSEGTVVLGVVLCFLFILTSAMSIYAVMYYRKNGSMPGATSDPRPIEDQTKYAFSSNPHEHDEFNTADPEVGGATTHGYQNPHAATAEDEDDYDVLHPQPTDEEGGSWGHPHQPGELGEQDTSYHGATSTGYGLQQHQDPFRNPSPYRESPEPSYHQPGSYEHPSAIHAGAGDPFRDDLGLSHPHGGYAGAGGRVDIPDVNDYRPR